MKSASDAIVIGGGPVGAFAALNLARLGLSVNVFEEHPEPGIPSHCAGHLSIKGLNSLGLSKLPSGIVENTFSGANFYSAKGTKFSVRLRKPVTCAVNRALFDKFLFEAAAKAGAKFFFSQRVKSLIVKNSFVVGVRVGLENKKEMQTESKVVVDSEGVSSRLLRQAGLATLDNQELIYGVEAEVENIRNVVTDEVEVYLGREYAPGFYAWLIPRPDGTAKVGLAARKSNPKALFHRLLSKHPVASKQLYKAKVTRMAFHPITLGGPISKTYSNGFLAVGDVASQVKPTTGGGVICGLTCARIAAEVIAKAAKTEDSSSNSLQLYQKRFNDVFGFDFKIMLKARRFLSSLSDEKVDNTLQFCERLKLDRSLQDVEEIDFQGQTLLKILVKPSAFAGLVYLLMLYLTTNP